MKEIAEVALFNGDLTPEEAETLHRLLQEDAVLAESFAVWRRMRAHIRSNVQEIAPDRSLLVCYALEGVHGKEWLTDEERAAVTQAKSALEQAIRTHPGLADVVHRIQADARLFEELWSKYVPEQPHAAVQPDRPPVSRSSDRTPRTRRWLWRTGAVAALAAFSSIAVYLVQRDQQTVTIQTAENEVRVVELVDGSSIRLMGGSSLSYPSAEAGASFQQNVRLTGRAFFEIAPQEGTFTVQMPTALATVLGTSFGVHATDEVAEVILAEGRVAVAPAGAPDRMVMLNEGEMSRVARNALPSTPAPVNLAEELEWTGLFIFRAAPVEEIARQISRRYGVTVTVNPTLAQETVTGTFEQADGAPAILEAVALTLGAAVQQDGESYTLR
jgi:transmembrane sensor